MAFGAAALALSRLPRRAPAAQQFIVSDGRCGLQMLQPRSPPLPPLPPLPGIGDDQDLSDDTDKEDEDQSDQTLETSPSTPPLPPLFGGRARFGSWLMDYLSTRKMQTVSLGFV